MVHTEEEGVGARLGRGRLEDEDDDDDEEEDVGA